MIRHQHSDSSPSVRPIVTHEFVAQSRHKLEFSPRQCGLFVEHRRSSVEVTVLQAHLGERGDGGFAVGVNFEGLLDERNGTLDVLFPLENGQTFVDHRKDVDDAGSPEQGRPRDVSKSVRGAKKRDIEKSTHLAFSISMARSNLLIASSNFCWSRSNSPLIIVEFIHDALTADEKGTH